MENCVFVNINNTWNTRVANIAVLSPYSNGFTTFSTGNMAVNLTYHSPNSLDTTVWEEIKNKNLVIVAPNFHIKEITAKKLDSLAQQQSKQFKFTRQQLRSFLRPPSTPTFFLDCDPEGLLVYMQYHIPMPENWNQYHQLIQRALPIHFSKTVIYLPQERVPPQIVFFLGIHPRAGADSPVSMLPNEILERIVNYSRS